MPITPTIPESDTNRLARLRGGIAELLASARRGDRSPSFIELLALHGICIELGAYDLASDLRLYIGEASRLRPSKPLSMVQR